MNRQGPDVGTQYRSAIFYADEGQKQIAQAYISQLDQSHAFARPIVTRVDPLKGFYPAEGYHQDYLIHNPTQPYIAFYDLPKIENFRRTFPELYSGQPVLAQNLAIMKSALRAWLLLVPVCLGCSRSPRTRRKRLPCLPPPP